MTANTSPIPSRAGTVGLGLANAGRSVRSDTLLQNPSPELPRKFTHRELVEIAAQWCKNKYGVVLPEFVCMASEIPDVLAMDSHSSVMIEVKVSRADFFRDKKKHFRAMEEYGMGNYRYYCVPKGLISTTIEKDELPDGWGLIEVNDKGKARLKVHALLKKTNYQAERRVLYSYARRAVVKGLHPEIMKSMAQEAADRLASEHPTSQRTSTATPVNLNQESE